MLERYIIKKKIGSGAFGTVYLVLDKNTKKQYALKKINVYRKKQKEKEYIISEIIIQKAHKSPYIIKLYDVFFEKDYIYIVSEYAENGDLNDIIQERIKNKKWLSNKMIAKWIIQLSTALKYLHDNKIIHRDIKSSNIFLDKNYDIKLGDLGIAKILNVNKLANTYVGTPYYMAPEIYNGMYYNNKCDIWSFGCIIYQLLTLRMPFNGSNMIQLANCVKYSTPNYKYIPKYKNEYKSILVKMLQKSSYARCDINFIYNNKFIRSLLSEEKVIVPVNNKVNNNFKIIYQLVNIRNWKNIITELNSKITETIVNYSKTYQDFNPIEDNSKPNLFRDVTKRRKSKRYYSRWKINKYLENNVEEKENKSKKKDINEINNVNKQHVQNLKSLEKIHKNIDKGEKLEPIKHIPIIKEKKYEPKKYECNKQQLKPLHNGIHIREKQKIREKIKEVESRLNALKNDKKNLKPINKKYNDAYNIYLNNNNYYKNLRENKFRNKIENFKKDYVSPYKFNKNTYRHRNNSDAIKAIFNY